MARGFRLLRIGPKATCAAKQHYVYLALQNVTSHADRAFGNDFWRCAARPTRIPLTGRVTAKSPAFFLIRGPLALAGFFFDFYAIGSQDFTNFGA